MRFAESHPSPAKAAHFKGTWKAQQEDQLCQGDRQGSCWVRLNNCAVEKLVHFHHLASAPFLCQ